MNNVSLIGRLIRDPEVRYTQNQKMYAQFNLAVNKVGVEGADFINIVAWNKTAELVSLYFKKGNKIGITGRINTRNYDDKDGKKVYVTEVIAENIDFCDNNKNNNVETTTDVVNEVDNNFTVEVEDYDWEDFANLMEE